MTDTVEIAGGQREREPAPPDGADGTSWLGLVGLLIGLGVLGWASLPALIIVLAIVFIVFLHELGHYLTARWSGMKVTEFFIGFGPRIWSFRRGETEYGIKAIWAGAYVKIIGMSNIEEVDPGDEDRTYRVKSFPKKVMVAVAGSTMHFLLVLGLLAALYVNNGVPRELDFAGWTVGDVTLDSAAAGAGIEPGDKVVEVDGTPITTFDDLIAEVGPRPGEQVDIVVERPDGDRREATVELGVADDGTERGLLGISQRLPPNPPEEVSALAAAPRAVVGTGDLIVQSVQGIGTFFNPTNLVDFADRVFSPPGSDDALVNPESRPVSVVGIVQIGAGVARDGIWDVVYLMALFNAFIGVFNLIPLLPFDGGHVAIATYERIRSRRGERYEVDMERLVPFVYGVVILLVFFGVGALYLDIANPFPV